MRVIYNSKLKSFANQLRNNSTESEIEMWKFLKNNYSNIRFNRQKSLDNFIVDFYCFKYNLIIEIDGSIHDSQKEKDEERDVLFLYKYNLKTIRFSNEQVLNNKKYLKKVLDEVLH